MAAGCLLSLVAFLLFSAPVRAHSATESSQAANRKLVILLMSTSAGGHLIPIVSLGQGLLDRGHDVYISVPYVNEAMPGKFINGTGLKYIPTHGGRESLATISKSRMTALSVKTGIFVRLLRAWAMYFSRDRLELQWMLDSGTASQDGIRYRPEDGGDAMTVKPDVIVADRMSSSQRGEYLASIWNIPVIMNSPSVNWHPPRQPFPFLIYCTNAALSEMTFWDRAASVIWFSFNLYSVVNYAATYYASKEFQRICKCTDSLLYLPEAGKDRVEMLNTVVGFDYPLLAGPLTVYTGPLIYPPASHPEKSRAYFERQLDGNVPLKDWLARWNANEVTVVSMGSYARVGRQLGEAMLKGFLATGQPTVWSLRHDNRDFVPLAMREGNGTDLLRLEDWIPQQAILAHAAVGVFVSHCGFGGTHEGLYFGKPILCLPVMVDQPALAARLRDSAAGVSLDASTVMAPDITTSLQRIRSKSSFALAAKRISRYMQLAGGVEKAAETVEYVAEVGSDHWVLPSFWMPWMLRSNIDVHIFLAAALLLAPAMAVLWLRGERTRKPKAE
eukprot:TRINITY_DN3021_c0_g1_i7.p1 TRINITY_DN3021_c0_g1~~TRINITY_DN3021_c0_g1_i7.p1  ORF type:complete len:585 (+),score=112.27 TRINITY_DN3021_c0_g1_i7:83-1756(+)